MEGPRRIWSFLERHSGLRQKTLIRVEIRNMCMNISICAHRFSKQVVRISRATCRTVFENSVTCREERERPGHSGHDFVAIWRLQCGSILNVSMTAGRRDKVSHASAATNPEPTTTTTSDNLADVCGELRMLSPRSHGVSQSDRKRMATCIHVIAYGAGSAYRSQIHRNIRRCSTIQMRLLSPPLSVRRRFGPISALWLNGMAGLC